MIVNKIDAERRSVRSSRIINEYFLKLMEAPRFNIALAKIPAKNGVYAFSFGEEIVYIGEAAGSGGLADRILRKHVAGDESHALQAEFELKFPDRMARRQHIKNNVGVQWVEIRDSLVVKSVESFAIYILKPRLNKSVLNRTFR